MSRPPQVQVPMAEATQVSRGSPKPPPAWATLYPIVARAPTEAGTLLGLLVFPFQFILGQWGVHLWDPHFWLPRR